MEFGVKVAQPATVKSKCIVLPVFDDKKMPDSTQAVDEASGKFISKLIKQGDIKGKLGEINWLHQLEGVTAPRILLIGLGKKDELNEKNIITAAGKVAQSLKSANCADACWFVEDLHTDDRRIDWSVRLASQTVADSFYYFEQLKSKKREDKPVCNKIFWTVTDKALQKSVEQASAEGQAIAAGMQMTKDLGNLPGNVCTPSYLEKQAESLEHSYSKFKTKILDEKAMEQLGMGALLSVSKGSREPAKFIIMEYHGGKKKDKPVVLVGKGLTFDAGGISIKPAQAMDEMKYDMCGGASVFGTLKAVAEMQLPINVIGVVPSSENLPDGQANKPGDIVTSLSGQTIEILNTDAEGRLILCDALTYVERYEPAVVIDIATLTGACVIALGKVCSGMFANDDSLAEEIKTAANDAYDRVWQLPLWDDYQEQLKSNFADMANIGGREGGTITAACFLSRYAQKYRWAHLDIAGTAWVSGAEKGATGRPVPLLTQYLINHSKQ